MPKTNWDPRSVLCDHARSFYERGWMVGTAGNLSSRLADDSMWITASGRMKGRLTPDDFIRIGADNTVVERFNPSDKPSAETSIHRTLYELFPGTTACYHVHSVEANLVSNFANGDDLTLPALEMIKGLGIWDEAPNVSVPVFENVGEVTQIAVSIRARFEAHPPRVPVLLIRNHGVTVWSDSTQGAFNAVELTEYIFRYMVLARQLGIHKQ